MTYAIIQVAGKQYRVREGERLLVDRLSHDEGSSFAPTVLLVGGDGAPVLDPAGIEVSAKVVGTVRGPKIRIGKYKKRTGYRRHTGFRAALSQIEIESIGGKAAGASKRKAPVEKAKKPAKAERPGKATAPTSAGPPAGYADLTVAAIRSSVGDWSVVELEAARAYEQEHGKRKGALAALESALEQQGGAA